MKLNKIFAAAFFSCAVMFASAQTKTVDLFNGTDLKGWDFYLDGNAKPENVFKVQDWVIHVEGTPFGFMSTQKEYTNFKLHVEWRWPGEPSNSGIFLYVQNEKKLWPNAVECQLFNGNAGDFVLLGGSDVAEFKVAKGEKRPEYPVVKKFAPSSEMKAGEWNNADIVCEKGKITVYINGVLQNIGTKSMHKKGRVALQSEGKAIQFRNVRLTPLD